MAEWQSIDFAAPSGRRVLAKVRAGNGKAPAFVYLAGTWGNARTRGPLLEALDKDLHLVCVTLAGQDENWPPPEEFSIPLFAADVEALAGRLGLEKFFVGGHSLGGMIAIELLRLGPERLRGAVSIEGWTHWSVAKAAFGGDMRSTQSEEQRALMDAVRAELQQRWAPEAFEAYGSMWTRWDGSERLASTPVPVLEIWGDRGRARPDRATMRIPDRANIELAWIANCSHSLHVEAPGGVAELINGFVKRNGG